MKLCGFRIPRSLDSGNVISISLGSKEDHLKIIGTFCLRWSILKFKLFEPIKKIGRWKPEISHDILIFFGLFRVFHESEDSAAIVLCYVSSVTRYVLSTLLLLQTFVLQVPYDHYLLLPNWYSQLKMTIFSFMPQRLAQSWAAKKYTKALPQVTPMTPVRMRHASMRSTGSYSSTLSSVLTSSSYWNRSLKERNQPFLFMGYF